MALMTTDEFAEEAHVTPRTVERWARDGLVPTVRFGRRWLIDAERALAPEDATEAEQEADEHVSLAELPTLLERIGVDPERAALVTDRIRDEIAAAAEN